MARLPVTLDGTTGTTVTGDEIKALADAERRLAAKVARLQAFRLRAVQARDAKLTAEADAQLKEANSLKARLASVKGVLQPAVSLYNRAVLGVSDWLSSTLGALPQVVVAGIGAGVIAALIYAINVWDRNAETFLERGEAELKLRDEWKKRGATDAEATAKATGAAAQYSAEKQAEASRPGVLEQLQGAAKWGGLLLLAVGGYQLMKNKNRTAN